MKTVFLVVLVGIPLMTGSARAEIVGQFEGKLTSGNVQTDTPQFNTKAVDAFLSINTSTGVVTACNPYTSSNAPGCASSSPVAANATASGRFRILPDDMNRGPINLVFNCIN